MTESLWLSKTSKITKCHRPPPQLPTARVPQCHIPTLLAHLHGRWLPFVHAGDALCRRSALWFWSRNALM